MTPRTPDFNVDVSMLGGALAHNRAFISHRQNTRDFKTLIVRRPSPSVVGVRRGILRSKQVQNTTGGGQKFASIFSWPLLYRVTPNPQISMLKKPTCRFAFFQMDVFQDKSSQVG